MKWIIFAIYGGERERERIIRGERENNKMTNNRLDSEKQNIDTER